MSTNPAKQTYVVALSTPFAIEEYRRRTVLLPGRWVLVTEKEQLTTKFLDEQNPRYVFFPHWSYHVPRSIHKRWECVCFHAADVPYGRGGTPIQNLIARGHRSTVLTALRMVEALDSGPVYLKRELSLEGLAEEIYLRIAKQAFDMIEEILELKHVPVQQSGEVVVFDRRTPEQSALQLEELEDEQQVFDFIRMLDAEGYPPAFLEIGEWVIEFKRPALRRTGVWTDAVIRRKRNDA